MNAMYLIRVVEEGLKVSRAGGRIGGSSGDGYEREEKVERDEKRE